MMPLARIRIHDEVLWADHDMPCAVCRVEPAVLFMNTGNFEPCWKCQEQGWQLRRKRRWWQPLSRYAS